MMRQRKAVRSFLDEVKGLPCWRANGEDSFLANDFEVLFMSLFSMIEFSCMAENVRGSDMKKLADFGKQSGVSPERQIALIRKVRGAGWDVQKLIAPDGMLEAFLDDFVDVCLRDKKVQPYEYRMLYLIGKYLNLSKEKVSDMLQLRLSKLRYRAILFFERPLVSALITILIIVNAIQLGLMTYPGFRSHVGPWFFHLDFAFICIFTLEILCRIYAFRWDFFKESQNIFDFVVVFASWIPLPMFRWGKALRIFRAMLLLNRLGQTKSIVRSLLDALPNIGWLTAALFLFYYVFAVLTTTIFGTEFVAFQSIGNSFLSLFQLMTLEGWPDLVYPIAEKYPYAWLIFIPFMLVTSYIFLNLVIGIIVTSMHDISLKKNTTEMMEIEEIHELKEQMNAMAQQISTLQELLAKTDSGTKDSR